MNANGRSAPRRVAGRWSMRLVLAVVVLAQLFACQAVLATVVGTPTIAIQDIGHDAVCEAGPAAAGTPTARIVAPDCAPPTGASAVLALVAAALVLAGRAGTGGMPSWAPARHIDGRHRLLAVGITRV